MRTVEQLTTRIKELNKQVVALRRQGTSVYLTDPSLAKQLRQQAREASKRSQVLIQELKRQAI
ncbi:MAG: hypothetical protein H0X31_00100 [Nostocaceae cyanobacterium]|nr:hypothetical protein [Nostocaceae cyanobacterium]